MYEQLISLAGLGCSKVSNFNSDSRKIEEAIFLIVQKRLRLM